MKVLFIFTMFFTYSVWANPSRSLKPNQSIPCLQLNVDFHPFSFLELNDQRGMIVAYTSSPYELSPKKKVERIDPVLIESKYGAGFFNNIDFSKFDVYTIEDGHKDILISNTMLDYSNDANNEAFTFEGYFPNFLPAICFPGSGCKPDRWVLRKLSCNYVNKK